MCAKNSASLSPVVAKASAGALELTPLFETRNMPRFLDACAAGGWRVVGTTLGKGSVALRSLERGQPTVVVLGNEGRGLRTLVARACGALVSVERGAGAEAAAAAARGGGVDSLNVAVTGALVLHHLLG